MTGTILRRIGQHPRWRKILNWKVKCNQIAGLTGASRTCPSASALHVHSFSTNSNSSDEDRPSLPASVPVTQRDYVNAISELSKARLSALVVTTSAFGYFAAAAPISYSTLAAASLGTALCSSSASTLNQIYEQDRDAKMKRTSQRPLVTKKVVGVQGALALATTTGISGGSILYFGTDPITTALGVGNIALYAGIYTSLKPKSEWNTWVGALVGAVPPVMGYTAATQGNGLFDTEAALVGGILFLWQFPHFFALSWMHRLDYARGGFQMVSRNDMPEGIKTARLITRYTYFMATMPFLSTLADVTSSMFAIEGIALNGYAIYVAKKFEKERSNANARKVFLTSLWYLPCWMTLYILHSRKWKEGVQKEDNTTITCLMKHVEDLRARGKELCLHEILILGGRDERATHEQKEEHEKCPVFPSSKKE